MDYKGKHILVLGAGSSGIGSAEILADLGAKVILDDSKKVEFDPAEKALLHKAGVTIITGSQETALLEHIDRIIVSPGISLEIPILLAAREKHIEVVGEIELAWELAKAPVLGVTGTNGKTTTTMLLGEVMRASGKQVCIGGNIGDVLSQQVLTVPAEGAVVAELSSYQLESISRFHAKGAIILNITPDHLQRHKTMEAYQAAKENIFKNQNKDDITVLNLDDERVAEMAPRVPGQVLWVSRQQPVAAGAWVRDGEIIYTADGHDELVMAVKDIPLMGAHNVENVLAVVALTRGLGVPAEVISRTVRSFGGVEHRLEPVRAIDGVVYYNDSKATNTDSAIKALEAFSVPVVLLAGGYDKLTDLTDFMALVQKKVKRLILMGNAAPRFAEAARQAGMAGEKITIAATMEEAVQLGKLAAETGEVVLLSPACSSFDWYSCFEERGEAFKAAVRALPGNGGRE